MTGPLDDGPQQATSAAAGILVGTCGVLLTACGASWLRFGVPRGGSMLHSAANWERRAAIVFVLLGLVVLVWWLLSFLVALLSEALRRRGHVAAAERTALLAPAFIRRLAAALLGAQLLVVPAAQATAPLASAETSSLTTSTLDLAIPMPDSTVPTAAWTDRNLPSPLWNAERPAAPLDRLMGQQRDAATPGNTVVVGAGDSLWLIAARMAGPGASDAQIARSWPRWYQTNREAIGPDPDLLHIGTVLTRPRAELDQNGK